MYEEASDRSEYPDHQLVPVKGGRYTDIIHGPPGTDVGDLHNEIELVGDTFQGREVQYRIAHSGWMPSEDQIAQLESGAHIRLTIHSLPIPPVSVSVEPPVDQNGDPMVWSPGIKGFITMDAARRFLERDAAEGFESEEEAARFLREQASPEEAEAQVRRDFTAQPPDDTE